MQFFRSLLHLHTLSGSTFSLQPWNKGNSSEEEYMPSLIPSDKIKARHCHSTKHLILIDDICTINDRGEFERSFYVISKGGQTWGSRWSCYILDKTMKEGAFIYKSFDKRDSSSFLIMRMHHVESNILQNNFYSAIKVEFLPIASSTLCVSGFINKILKFNKMHEAISKNSISSST